MVFAKLRIVKNCRPECGLAFVRRTTGHPVSPVSAARTHLCDHGKVKGSEFLRKVRGLARRRGTSFRYESSMGKGSHGRVFFDGQSTILKDPKKELGPGLLRSMCRDLNID